MDVQLVLDEICRAAAQGSPETFEDALAVLPSLATSHPGEARAYSRWLRETAEELVPAAGAEDGGRLVRFVEEALRMDAASDFDSYMLFMEWRREPKRQFYRPRRLVLEPSSETVYGRNDYYQIGLFACPRCNGGADADGMPYVTAIEGEDDRFDAAGANTYVITPIYSVTHTEEDDYDLYEYEYGVSGDELCAGAYTAQGEARPFILRACYMDSDGNCSSKSGTMPASWVNYDTDDESGEAVEYYYEHTPDKNWENVQSRADGLTYLTYGDMAYMWDMMVLMLGVKAPKLVASGCIDSSATYANGCTLHIANDEAWVEVDGFANDVTAGMRVSIGLEDYTWYANSYSVCYAHSAKVLSVVDSKIYIDPDALTGGGSDGDTCSLWAGYWPNGSCDAVCGTFGTPDLAHLVDGTAPFRFQNIEWGLGKAEIVSNVVVADHIVCLYPNVRYGSSSRPTTLEEGYSYGLLLDSYLFTEDGYVLTYMRAKGAWMPADRGGNTSLGCIVMAYQHYGDGGSWLVGGAMNPAGLTGAQPGSAWEEQGPGFVFAAGGGSGDLVGSHWVGARSSTIGLSEPVGV